LERALVACTACRSGGQDDVAFRARAVRGNAVHFGAVDVRDPADVAAWTDDYADVLAAILDR
jgi:hypothetical protein